MNYHPTAPADQARHHPERIFQAGLALHHIANTAYPIGHLTTMRPYRVITPEAQRLAPLAWQDSPRLGLYVHIPFCEQRCNYCEYCVVDPLPDCHPRGGLLRRPGAGVRPLPPGAGRFGPRR